MPEIQPPEDLVALKREFLAVEAAVADLAGEPPTPMEIAGGAEPSQEWRQAWERLSTTQTDLAVSEGELVDALLQLTFDNPMPDGLRERIADTIEPYTMHCGLEHDDVMTCIKIAWVLIRDFEHGR